MGVPEWIHPNDGSNADDDPDFDGYDSDVMAGQVFRYGRSFNNTINRRGERRLRASQQDSPMG